jgi:hypothetical protein
MEAEGNLYATTIHVLVSAVQKVARVMKLPEGLRLYRGMGGLMDLPDQFFRADEHGCKGFAEWGFMSTTSDKAIALQYSGAGEGRPLPMVMEMVVGAVDRGACIRDLSQYPREVEYLWGPCSFVAPDGEARLEVSPFGVVKLVPVRVNANLSARTVEELVGQKKRTHLACFRYLLAEVRGALRRHAEEKGAEDRLKKDTTRNQGGEHTVEELLGNIAAQCEERMAKHARLEPEAFAQDEAFRRLVTEMLDTRRWAVSKLRLWLEDGSQFIAFMGAK